QFSRAGAQVAEELDDAARERAREYIQTVVRDLRAEGEPPLTENPKECEFCGFRRVGLCPGAAPDA
ncbi:MAG: hypothetical protein ACOC9N_02710, partial [Gemmatimonadota bacterium]